MFSLKETSDEKREMKSRGTGYQEYLDTKVKCEKCHWEGTYRQCNFGHDDYYCPSCLVESLVQV